MKRGRCKVSEMVDEDGEEVAALFGGVELLGLFVDSGRMIGAGGVVGGGGSVGRRFDLAPLASFVGRLQRDVPFLARIPRPGVRDPQFDRLQEAQTFGAALHQRAEKSLTCTTQRKRNGWFL